MNKEGSITGIGSGKNEVELISKNRETLWRYRTDSWITSLDVSIYGRYIAAGLQNGKILFFDNEKIIKDFIFEAEGKIDVTSIKEKLEQKKYSDGFHLINGIEKEMRKKRECALCVKRKWKKNGLPAHSAERNLNKVIRQIFSHKSLHRSPRDRGHSLNIFP
ncbi:MAG: hypothetical protein KKB04_00825 [Candidatus Thermoplasmatota archaeon]|nr:hypothetical protein [Candidatus Thermoplasmatota archaeon]